MSRESLYIIRYLPFRIWFPAKVYAVLYNREDKTYWVETGPDIISAVPLTSYLSEYDLIKASYSKEEIKDIYIKIKNDYEKEKELDNSGKVYIKNNSIY